MTELPLFLLNTVLFPGMALPLRVFERRYRQLVADCIARDQPFGVALIREGVEVGDEESTPYSVGCTARILNHTPSVDGKLLIAISGERRFRILEMRHEGPYPSATVEYPGDEGGDVPPDLVERALAGYTRLGRLRAISEGAFRLEVRAPAQPGVLADRIAASAQGTVENSELQRVIEAFDLGERLEAAIALLAPVIESAEREARSSVAQRFGGPERLN